MDRFGFKIKILVIILFVMLPSCQDNTMSPENIPEENKWQPPKAPDQMIDAPIEYLNRAVLRIKSTWNDLDEVIHQESGAGIALGMKRGKLYIMTAAHVVRDKIHGSADNIEVILKRSPRENYSAELVDYDSERDFAVLITQTIGNEQDWDIFGVGFLFHRVWVFPILVVVGNTFFQPHAPFWV